MLFSCSFPPLFMTGCFFPFFATGFVLDANLVPAFGLEAGLAAGLFLFLAAGITRINAACFVLCRSCPSNQLAASMLVGACSTDNSCARVASLHLRFASAPVAAIFIPVAPVGVETL